MNANALSTGRLRFLGGWYPPLLALIGIALVLFATGPAGSGATSDVAAYYSVAESLARGDGFTQYDGSHYSSWPPLLPIILSIGPLVGSSPAAAARILNALVFGAIVLVFTRWLILNLRSRLLAYWGGLAMLFAYQMFKMSLHAWTEPLFVLLTLLFLTALISSVEKKGRGSLLPLILFAMFAWTTRYIGITLVGTGCLVLLFIGRDKLDKRFLRALGFGFFASVLPAFIILSNILITGDPAGERSVSSFGLLTCFRFSLRAIAWWIFPERLGTVLPGIVTVLLGVGVLVTAWRMRSQLRERARRIGILMLFFIIYLGFLIYTSTQYAFEGIHSRYLIPLHPTLMLVFILVLDMLIERSKGRIWGKLILAGLALWLLYPIAQTAVFAKQARTPYTNYASAPVWNRSLLSGFAWRNSDLARLLRESPPAGTLISNYPEAVYLHAGLGSTRSPRARMHVTSKYAASELDDFIAMLSSSGPITLIWFADTPPHGQRRNFHDLQALAAALDLEEIATAEDGAIYRVNVRQ